MEILLSMLKQMAHWPRGKGGCKMPDTFWKENEGRGDAKWARNWQRTYFDACSDLMKESANRSICAFFFLIFYLSLGRETKKG